MPTLSMTELPAPLSWDELEAISWHLMRKELGDPNITRHGRQCQEQHGVDIYGRRNGVGEYVGIQCKVHSRFARITLAEVNNEVDRAESFEPPLKEFIVVTTSPRDARLQKEIRLLSMEREQIGKFPIFVRFWEDISARLALEPDIARHHYPQFFRSDAEQHSEARQHLMTQTIMSDPQDLRVFVSSRLHAGLDEERVAVANSVEGTGMARAWYWERDGYASIDGYLAVCKRYASESDAIVVLVGNEISAAVESEVNAAIAAGRRCYVFIKDGCQHDESAQVFVQQHRTRGAVRRFRNHSELRTHVVRALAAETASVWRLPRGSSRAEMSADAALPILEGRL